MIDAYEKRRDTFPSLVLSVIVPRCRDRMTVIAVPIRVMVFIPRFRMTRRSVVMHTASEQKRRSKQYYGKQFHGSS